jgi:hypothetical protein
VVYGVIPPQPGKDTFEGLGRLRTAALAAIGASAMGMIIGLIVISTIGSLTSGDLGAVLAAAAGIIILGILVVIIGLIAVIFALWGLSTVNTGRKEFGEGHEASVKKGVQFIIIAMLMQVASAVAGAVLGVSSVGLNIDQMRNGLLMSVGVGGAIGLIAVIFYGLGMQLLLEKLMTSKGRGLKMPFLGIAVGGGVLSFVLAVVSVLIFDPFALNQGTGLSSLASILSIVSIYIYFMQLKDAEQGARNMIASGQYNPDATAPGAPPAAPM